MTKRTTCTLLGLWFLTAAACDDSGENRKAGPTPATPTPEKTTPPKATPEAKTAPPPDTKTPTAVTGDPAKPDTIDISGVVRTYSACYSGCFKEGASATNRETCKLNCDAVAESALEGQAGGPPKDKFKDAMTTFTGCVNGCYGDKTLNRTNRETCILTCQDSAEVSVASK